MLFTRSRSLGSATKLFVFWHIGWRRAGIWEAECEVRRPAGSPQSWGEPLAALEVLMVVHGDPSITTTEIRSHPGTLYGEVRLQAAWAFAVPQHLLGIVQLQTVASVSSFGVLQCSLCLYSFCASHGPIQSYFLLCPPVNGVAFICFHDRLAPEAVEAVSFIHRR